MTEVSRTNRRDIPFSQHLSTNGDGTGTVRATGNYASTPLTLYITPAADEIMSLVTLTLAVSDVGGFDSGKYGNNVVLTNGILFNIKDADDVIISALTDLGLTTNGMLSHFFETVTYLDFGSGNPFLQAHIHFLNSFGGPLILRPGEKLEAIFNDDFSDIELNDVIVKGMIVNSRQ